MATIRRSDNDTGPAGYIVGLALAVILIAISSITHCRNVKLMETFTASSPGVVSRVEEGHTRRNKRRIRTYSYVVSFEDSDGIGHEAKSLARSDRRPIHSEGDEVIVRYDPRKADEACVIEGDESLV